MNFDHENDYIVEDNEGIYTKGHENSFKVIDDDGASFKMANGEASLSNSKIKDRGKRPRSKSMGANEQSLTTMGEYKIMPMVGDKGPEVRELQNLLVKNGFKLPKFGIDGDFGQETQEAVINAQDKFGLKPNGIVTEELMRKLRGQTGSSREMVTTTAQPNYKTTASTSKGFFSKLTPVHYIGGAAVAGIALIWWKNKK